MIIGFDVLSYILLVNTVVYHSLTSINMYPFLSVPEKRFIPRHQERNKLKKFRNEKHRLPNLKSCV